MIVSRVPARGEWVKVPPRDWHPVFVDYEPSDRRIPGGSGRRAGFLHTAPVKTISSRLSNIRKDPTGRRRRLRTPVQLDDVNDTDLIHFRAPCDLRTAVASHMFRESNGDIALKPSGDFASATH
jgi:hypothetical protein